jgi:hypothetical protein
VNFSFDRSVAVSPEVALCAYGEPSFYDGRTPVNHISVIEVVSHEDNDTTLLIEVRFKFTGSVSAAVKAVIDPDKMSWVTRTEVLLEERRTNFTVRPDHYPDRLTSSGSFVFADGPTPNSAVITVAGQLKVHVPIVGRTVERTIESGLHAYIEQEVATLPAFAAGTS